jgi:hypothetical protein
MIRPESSKFCEFPSYVELSSVFVNMEAIPSICCPNGKIKRFLLAESESYVTTDGQSVLEYNIHQGLTTGFLLMSDSCGFVNVGRSL